MTGDELSRRNPRELGALQLDRVPSPERPGDESADHGGGTDPDERMQARDPVPHRQSRHQRLRSSAVTGTLMKIPASTNTRMAAYCAAIHQGPATSSGNTGFHATAIAS